MKIIEEFINSKSGKMEECEDGLFHNRDFVVVVDGVTSKSKLSKNGLTGGYIAKEVIIETVKTFPRTIKSTEAIAILSEKLKSQEENIGVKATLVIYSDYHKEIWVYGNCQIMINGKRKKYETRVDKLFSLLRSFVINDLLQNGTTKSELLENDKSREIILGFLKDQSEFENTENYFGYSVLNGVNDSTDKADIIQVGKGDEIIIATDGYPLVYDTLKKSEAYLKNIITKDPLCFDMFKSTKGVYKGNISYDDRTYVKFVIE